MPMPITVRELRRKWKPHKERLSALDAQHPTPVRFHRACSWLQRVEKLAEENDRDFALVGQWTALNALYGRWDERAKEPLPDAASLRSFIDKLIKIDTEGQLGAVLRQQQRLILSILDDEYLSRYYWQDPSVKRAGQSKKAKYDAATCYHQQNWALLLDNVLVRVYLLRCQIVHGAATHGSQLNRVALGRCITLMDHLLCTLLQIWIDHGANEDWGAMCYPPRTAQ